MNQIENFEAVCVVPTGRGGYDVFSNITGLLRQGVVSTNGVSVVVRVVHGLATENGKRLPIIAAPEIVGQLPHDGGQAIGYEWPKTIDDALREFYCNVYEWPHEIDALIGSIHDYEVAQHIPENIRNFVDGEVVAMRRKALGIKSAPQFSWSAEHDAALGAGVNVHAKDIAKAIGAPLALVREKLRLIRANSITPSHEILFYKHRTASNKELSEITGLDTSVVYRWRQERDMTCREMRFLEEIEGIHERFVEYARHGNPESKWRARIDAFHRRIWDAIGRPDALAATLINENLAVWIEGADKVLAAGIQRRSEIEKTLLGMGTQ